MSEAGCVQSKEMDGITYEVVVAVIAVFVWTDRAKHLRTSFTTTTVKPGTCYLHVQSFAAKHWLMVSFIVSPCILIH